MGEYQVSEHPYNQDCRDHFPTAGMRFQFATSFDLDCVRCGTHFGVVREIFEGYVNNEAEWTAAPARDPPNHGEKGTLGKSRTTVFRSR
ncbi:hypothetical protein M0D69_03250 [Caballeronia sp. SEWSISQ10-4 2]|uniref:hypothetical protein n=1 Tax=Caballeronia sp. SEWSISQ10-4 2 TaxID=2937438 RepID=UPI00264F4EDC|nr:hypothetical protein [Caballeronia sp. SEWSISQ10-4 2]MDN7177047.1 hypothetical protein [Caballeronia sp. SEWSISQ10-4 2]